MFFSASLPGAPIEITKTITVKSGAESRTRPTTLVWEFESESGAAPLYGQFACGSWWVAPAGADTGVTLNSLVASNVGETHFISLDDNPNPWATSVVPWQNWSVNSGLYPTTPSYYATWGNADPTQDHLSTLPRTYTPGAALAISLVAGVERNGAEEGVAPSYSVGDTNGTRGGQMSAWMWVTVLAEAPPENGINSIRPNLVGTTKDLLTWDDFDLTRLPSRSDVTLSNSTEYDTRADTWLHSTQIFAMRQWNGVSFQSYSEGARAMRAASQHDAYSVSWAGSFRGSVFSLMSENTVNQKKKLLASVLAHGLDMYHLVFANGDYPSTWSSGAGQWMGQSTGSAFAAALLVDPAKKNRMRRMIVDNYGANGDLRGPQEMRQLMRGQTGVVLWGDSHDPVDFAKSSTTDSERRYWSELVGHCRFRDSINPPRSGTAQKTAADPYGYVDGNGISPGADYMSSTAATYVSTARMLLYMPEMLEVYNSPELIEYADRLVRHGIWALPDPVAIPAVVDQYGSGCSPFYGNAPGCTEWRVTWGPLPNDARYAFEDNAGGRFPHRHGLKLTTVTTTPEVWASYIDGYTGPLWEDKQVPLGVVVSPDLYSFTEGSEVKVFIRCATHDATIHYTTNGSDPTTSSPVYSGILTVADDSLVRAIAVKPGMVTSSVSGVGFVGATPEAPDPGTPGRTLRGSKSAIMEMGE